ncbi:hypothetical protein EVAR_24633_1 [Eumeta japonica]|uniref:Uncharacterized protein n=1 Tax=Eumeta variegata TaxID=151549 RepID=A0A4C1V1S1_EUMVA|nr:hypothetical protein EVAR_24633_1 [Eumeta japonica]
MPSVVLIALATTLVNSPRPVVGRWSLTSTTIGSGEMPIFVQMGPRFDSSHTALPILDISDTSWLGRCLSVLVNNLPAHPSLAFNADPTHTFGYNSVSTLILVSSHVLVSFCPAFDSDFATSHSSDLDNAGSKC